MPLPMTPTQLTVLIKVCAFDCKMSATRIFIVIRKTSCEFPPANRYLTLGMMRARFDSRRMLPQLPQCQSYQVLGSRHTFRLCGALGRTSHLDVSSIARITVPRPDV